MIRIVKIFSITMLLCWSVETIGQNDCQPLLTLIDDITMDSFYQAEVINSSANITSDNVVTFQAEDMILLTDGFQTIDVNQFHGYIADCTLVKVEELVAHHSIKLFPNPTNTITIFEYELIESADISLSVFNMLGQEVIQLIKTETHSSGKHRISFDARQLPSEIYFLRLNLNGKVILRKFGVVK